MVCPTCGAENPPGTEVCFHCRSVLEAITRGTLLAGRYEVLAPLGRGGMGLVYKAHDRVLDETVAIKLLRPEVALERDAIDRIAGEIKLARRVSHRNVCRIFEYGEDAGRRFIAMEHVDGVELRELIRTEGGLRADQAFGVAKQIAEGLAAIHEAGIVHRDLKTANIMRDSRGAVRLMDFGIAKQLVSGSTDASQGRLVGTPEYMSPEQARGGKVDFRSDVYALGVVVFELFTGEVPFKTESPLALLQMHLHEPPTLDTAVVSKLPPPLLPVLRRALSREPDQRFPSAAAMGEALAQAEAAFLAGRSGDAAPLSVARAAAVLHQPLVRWGALLLVLAVGIGLGMVLRSSRTPAGGSVSPVAAASPTTLSRTPAPTLDSPSHAPDAVSSAPPEAPPLGVAETGQSPAAGPGDVAAASTEARSPVARTGTLRLMVLPWAEVEVNGVLRGKTPLSPLSLPVGRHTVRLLHPDYRPIQRKVTIRAGETTLLRVDFSVQGIPK
jgi:serine/threonine-protein kinase